MLQIIGTLEDIWGSFPQHPDTMIYEGSGDQPWWKVDTVIDDSERTFFEAGWPEFAHSYHLKPFDKLELHYYGHHRFTIKVFDYGGHRRRYKDWVEGLGAEPIELDGQKVPTLGGRHAG